jgi:ABC-type sugar transport system permease subunit
MTQRDRQQRRFAVVCVTPAVVLFTLWVGWPTVRAFTYALTRWSGFGEPTYVGLRHFYKLLAGSDLLQIALKNNLILMVVPTVFTLGIALSFAAAIHRGVIGARFFQAVFFFPNILSAVAVAVLWKLVYSASEYGALNAIMRYLGRAETGWEPLDGLLWHLRTSGTGIGWVDAALQTVLRTEPYMFTDSRVLVWWLIPMLVWSAVGFFMLLFLAAMQNIPETLYEAARIDGASALRSFFQITLPLIRDTVVVALVFFGMAGLKIFDQVWVFEQQQARRESNTIATLMYARIFEEYRVGEGTAIAVIQFVLVLVVTVILLRLWRREALEY